MNFVSNNSKKSELAEGVAYLPPHSALRHLITGYYFIDNPKLFQNRTFTGTCCGVMPLHLFQDDTRIKIALEKKITESVFQGVLAGQLTSPSIIEYENPIHCVSIEMYPVALKLIFGFTADEILDDVVPSDDLPVKKLDILIDRLRHETSYESKKHLLDAYLLKRMKSNDRDIHFNHVFSWFLKSSGTLSIHELQKVFNISKRQFERRFKELSGAPASVIKRFIRCDAALSRILSGNDIQDVIFDLQYVDQSHLIKDIKRHTGKTPQVIYRFYKDRIFRLGRTTFLFP